MDWDKIPEQVGEPNFNNLLSVLDRRLPLRPTLFEFFLNDRLYDRFSSQVPDTVDPCEATYYKVMLAFRNAGYDYVNVLIPGFDFYSQRVKRERTVSLNEGAVITDWASFKSYRWPDPHKADYSLLDRLGKFLPKGMQFIGYAPDGVLENVIKLVGYERLCYWIMDDQHLVRNIFNEVGSRLFEFYRILCGHSTIGACIANDDWGFKTQTMLSPSDLRRFVFPWYKEIASCVHKAGKPIILHACGHFQRIMTDIVDEMQFDARHSYEDEILPVEDAYELYHPRIAILGGIDVDFVCRSTPEQVYQRSKAMLERTSERGGYALGTGNSVPDYVPDMNYLAMIKAALEVRSQ